MSRFIFLKKQRGGRIGFTVESIESWIELEVDGKSYGCTITAAGKSFDVEETWDRIKELLTETASTAG